MSSTRSTTVGSATSGAFLFRARVVFEIGQGGGRWPRLAPLLKSRATPLIVNGRIDQRALRREFMQRDELMAELRLHGITDPKDVARAYLEANGMVSVIRADGGEPDEPRKPPAVG